MTHQEFEEHVRRESVRILRALHHSHYDEAAQRTEELCELAATRQAQRGMQEEVAGEGRYDLATLPAPSADPFEGE